MTVCLRFLYGYSTQAFSKNPLKSIWKRLKDQKIFPDFYMEWDQGSLGVFRGPLLYQFVENVGNPTLRMTKKELMTTVRIELTPFRTGYKDKPNSSALDHSATLPFKLFFFVVL